MTTLTIILILAVFAFGFWVWKLRKSIGELEKRLADKSAEKPEEKKADGKADGLAKINQERIEAKERGKGLILEFLKEKGRITNNETEKLLGISDASATRYLDELEKEGKIRQLGATGSKVAYEPIGSLTA